jgi:hypothetical protein
LFWPLLQGLLLLLLQILLLLLVCQPRLRIGDCVIKMSFEVSHSTVRSTVELGERIGGINLLHIPEAMHELRRKVSPFFSSYIQIFFE